MNEIRSQYWKNLQPELVKSTVDGFTQVFLSGLSTVMGEPVPSDYTKNQWPRNYSEAFIEQQDIGWEQALYGRILRQWAELVDYNSQGSGRNGAQVWTGRAITLCWKFGLALWKVRNGMIHGTEGNVSVLEQQRVGEIALLLFRNRVSLEEGTPNRMFPANETAVVNMLFGMQKAWIEQLRFLYEEKYEMLLSQIGLHDRMGVG